MSKVIKIDDENYEQLRIIAFNNRVSIQSVADELVKIGLNSEKSKEMDVIDRGIKVKITR